MKRPYQIAAVVLILFSAFVARESLALDYYTYLGPGPGFFPFWLSLLMAFLAATVFYQATFGRGRSDPMPVDLFPSRIGYLRIAAVLSALTWAVVMINPLGFRLTMLAFFIFLLFALGRVNLFLGLAIALVCSFGAFYAFGNWLQVPLPVGVLGI